MMSRVGSATPASARLRAERSQGLRAVPARSRPVRGQDFERRGAGTCWTGSGDRERPRRGSALSVTLEPMSDLPQDFLAQVASLEPTYLLHDDPIRQSGFGGGAERWRAERGSILEAVTGDGDFLDIGCANGHLAECLVVWASERGIQFTPHGYRPRAALDRRSTAPPAAVRGEFPRRQRLGLASGASFQVRLHTVGLRAAGNARRIRRPAARSACRAAWPSHRGQLWQPLQGDAGHRVRLDRQITA